MRKAWFAVVLVCGLAAGQDKPAEKAPVLTKAQVHQLAVDYSDVMYAQAELRGYVADIEAKHPGWRIDRSQDGVYSFIRKSEPLHQPSPKPPVVPPVVKQ